MSSVRTEKFRAWLGLDGATRAMESSGPPRASLTARLVFLAGWAALAVVVYVYLTISATGEDGLGGYLPLVTSGLLFSAGSLLTQSAINSAEYGD